VGCEGVGAERRKLNLAGVEFCYQISEVLVHELASIAR
jgi:hypothetical protein